jgi:hypothetical protein
LSSYGVLTKNTNGNFALDSIDFESSQDMTIEDLNRNMNALSVNYMIANIEFHKLLYSDPYQYSDELKRIKNFLSPRKSLMHSSPLMNAAYNSIWNKGFSEKDAAYTNFNRDYFKTAVYDDILGEHNLPGYVASLFKETDGGGIISLKAYRNAKIRLGEWTDDNERQYRYDMVWEKNDKGKVKLSKEERDILTAGNPGIKSTYTAIKPIVSGNSVDGQSYNKAILDKFALYPISYRVMKQLALDRGADSINAVSLYNKMQREDVDYVLFTSSRKVGVTKANKVYNDETGEFNEKPYEGVTNIPFSIFSIQTDVPSKEDDAAPRGTQVTKLITMDFMEAGVPVDFKDSDGSTEFSPKRYKEWYDIKDETEREKRSPLYKEIKENELLLGEITEQGYLSLLDKLGITESEGEFKITDFSKTAKVLREEVMRREVNDNIIDALDDLEKGKVILEATPAYQQVRNILYSIVDKTVISPKITGGMKVQIPSTLLEETRVKAVDVEIKDKNGNVTGTKKAYTSDFLKFYTNKDGERVCEIMLARWFGGTLSDKEAIEYLNSPEGQKELLSGLGYRIPTQKQNSIDRFVIKQFLPKEFGDNVVVPAQLVQKSGTDFDIDKLSVYLKNTYIDVDGKPRLIPYLGIGEQARKELEKMYDDGVFVSLKDLEKLSKEQKQELDRILAEEESAIADDPSGKLLYNIFGRSIEKEIVREFITKGKSAKFKKLFLDNLYKKSIENGYIQSSENLVSHPANFDRLIAPNSADQLKGLARKIVRKTIGSEFDYSDAGNMLSRTFMSRLRHAFVSGKYAIGIAAVNQTNHSLNQRSPIYIDPDRIGKVSSEDLYWLTGGTRSKDDIAIKFESYNSISIDGKSVPTLSMIRNAERSERFPNGQDISDIIGQFIDGYVDIAKGPWIMELGAAPNVAGTWLFLAKVGVPIDTIAYFMNQPIVRDYLQSVENAGYTYLFMQDFVKLTKVKYSAGKDLVSKVKQIPSKKALEKMVGEKELTPQQNAEQQFILDEFLKYAKMAEHLRLVTQGTNFDTANLNDPYLLFKKEADFRKADSTIISSASDLLENSFVGDIRYFGNKSREAIARILKSDQSIMRNVMEKVLARYTDLSDREFVTVARKAVSDFFDWAVQTKTGVPRRNQFIGKLLLDENSGVKLVKDFKDSVSNNPNHALYNNFLVGRKGILDAIISQRIGATPDNLTLVNKDNKVYDQNMIIESFKELREHLKSIGRSDIYKNIVGIAILQSGLSTSKISFTNLLPYEDFVNVYNSALSMIETQGDVALMDFYNLHVFERNNWSDDNVVSYEKAAPPEWTGFGMKYNDKMKFKGSTRNVQKAINEGKIPSLLKMNVLSRAANSDFIVYSWEKMDDSILTDEERNSGMTIKQKKLEMRKAGDFSYINKGLFKKVYYGDGTPVTTSFTTEDGTVVTQVVYKMINAWGDSFRAKELYDSPTPSKIDNGFVKVESKPYFTRSYFKDEIIYHEKQTSNEMPDEEIVKYFPREFRDTSVSLPKTETLTPTQPSTGVEKTIKEFKVGEQVQDDKYNVWEIISQEEYQKESRIGTKAGVKVRFITNVNPNENRRQDALNPDSTTYIKPNSVNTLGENTLVQSTQQPASNKDVVNALKKTNTIDKNCNS